MKSVKLIALSSLLLAACAAPQYQKTSYTSSKSQFLAGDTERDCKSLKAEIEQNSFQVEQFEKQKYSQGQIDEAKKQANIQRALLTPIHILTFGMSAATPLEGDMQANGMFEANNKIDVSISELENRNQWLYKLGRDKSCGIKEPASSATKEGVILSK